MTLPGKLCIGILEEDNPLRSYFRFKPLLLDEGGSYVPFVGDGVYPNEGCIRIVPDKNESYHFKTRMRQMGLFCVVDLREHPNDNDKIRPNKNYRPEGEEINACIIYSDVVRAPAPGMIFDLLPETAAEKPIPTPRTGMVLLERDGAVNPTCHTWEAVPDADGMAALRATPAECPIDGLQVFELDGFRGERLRFAILSSRCVETVCDLPERSQHSEHPERIERVEKTVELEKPVIEAPAPDHPAEKEEPITPEHHEDVPMAPKRGPEPDKPWIHHDASIMPRPVDRRLSRADQLRAAQAGLNPRRGRSLQELIDEKWQHSRLNQLGMSAGPIVTGAPVRNPVDNAVEVLKEVWGQPSMRRPLIDALGQVDDFMDSLRAFRKQAGLSMVEAQLDSLEAQRLELLGELDKLKAGGQDVREQLKQEIRRDEAEALAEAVEKTRAAQADQAKYERLAEDARAAAKDARGLLDELTGDQLERKIRDVALIRRVEERLALLRGDADADPIVAKPERIDINAMIDRLVRRFDAEGWSLSRLDAANLCVCLALGQTLTLSGATGSGKTAAARMLADALGLGGAGRVVTCAPDPRNVLSHEPVSALRRSPEIPAIIILDDANLHPAPDALRGMGQVFDPEWRTILTVQDAHSGAPLNAAALDHGFMVRLSSQDNLPWHCRASKPAPEFTLASIDSIRASLPRTDLPAAIIDRMEFLRAGMAKRDAHISRRALDEAWRYCAAMLAILGDEADADHIFDLAIAQRVLPVLLASSPIEAALEFVRRSEKLPACQALLKQPLPISLG